MLQRMSIGQWFKKLFSGPARTDASPGVANEIDDEIDINEARIDAGGGGPIGLSSHASPGEEAGLAEEESE